MNINGPQLNFRDLPEIPVIKRWQENQKHTVEQDISQRLLTNSHVSKEELNAFASLENFYIELNDKLKDFDFTAFMESDFYNFKRYLFSAFSFMPTVCNDLSIYYTYRAVINENVTQKNARIRDINLLKYPPLEIVKKRNKFNRANTPNTTVFYSAENIDTTLKELRPPANKLITVGVWKPRKTRKFNAYPISNSLIAEAVNEGVRAATNASLNINTHELMRKRIISFLALLGREYTKSVSDENHLNYFISASFSDMIFQTSDLPNDTNFDCIIFPSVGNQYITDNLAIRPTVVDDEFILVKAIEFEIEEQYYDKPYTIMPNPESISLAKVKNEVTTTLIDNSSRRIFW